MSLLRKAKRVARCFNLPLAGSYSSPVLPLPRAISSAEATAVAVPMMNAGARHPRQGFLRGVGSLSAML